MPRNPETVSTKRQRIATLAKQSPGMSFTSLAYLMDIDWLREAFLRTRKDGAPGVDGQTAADYARDLDVNLASLLERAKSGTYRAPPVRRAYIPKGKGETRPIGIPTLEDKILQRAVVMLLEPIYEEDFLDCSYGFRPGRSAHNALESLWQQTMDQKGGWIVELDIRKCFDHLDHAHLRNFLQQRVCDGVIQRLIGKWLKAGVLEDGNVHYPDEGSPQGGVVSPLMANIYLHEVLDKWFEHEVKPRLKDRSFVIRFADDAVLGFAGQRDAERVLEVLPKRFARYGLELHPEKTRIVPFRRPRLAKAGQRREDERPGTFDFLGFTHFWGRSRKGHWVVTRKTAKDRFSRGLRRISAWCRHHRHESIKDQQRALSQKLRGHYAYYGITGNAPRLAAFAYWAQRIWRKWLGRRGGRHYLPWYRFYRILARYPLPRPVVVHSVYPRRRSKSPA